jgi:secreted trypsin-like serine protease
LVALSIQRGGNIRFSCGGTLISKFTVITAAHCLYDGDLRRKLYPEEVVVSMGRYEIQQYFEADAITKTAERLMMHENFNYKSDSIKDADIAIVIMQDGTIFNRFIQPICLWTESSDLQRVVGLSGTVVGWGKDESGAESTPTPNWVEIPIVSEAVCLREDAVYNYITSNRTFCAGALNGSGPCTGDSGGGFVMQRNGYWVLRGIVSTSLADPLKGCNENKYVVFTDVTKYRHWIRQNMM